MEKSLLSKSEGEEGTASNERVARAEIVCGLPPDIIIEILSRIPVASIIRFKCVCKLWDSLTKDQGLINSHLKLASSSNSPQIITFAPLLVDGTYAIHDLILIDASWKIKYGLRRISPGPIKSLPPCNGLMCFIGDGEIEILNPTTQENLRPPKLNSKGITPDNAQYSFGFHPLTKEYKLVRIFIIKMGRTTRADVFGCEVYTLGSSDSWRDIGTIIGFHTRSGINVNGSIYWIGGFAYIFPEKILVLDLKSEKFRYIGLPSFQGYEIKVDRKMSLVELEKNVCFVCASRIHRIMDIWMLKGDNNTWIHRHRVSIDMNQLEWGIRVAPMYFYEGSPRVWNDFGVTFRFEPIYIYEGKILLFRWGGLLYCRGLRSGRTVLVFRDEHVGQASEIYAFVETLVVPPCIENI